MIDLLNKLFRSKDEFALDTEALSAEPEKVENLRTLVNNILNLLGLDSVEELKEFFNSMDEEKFNRLVMELVEGQQDPDNLQQAAEAVLAISNTMDYVAEVMKGLGTETEDAQEWANEEPQGEGSKEEPEEPKAEEEPVKEPEATEEKTDDSEAPEDNAPEGSQEQPEIKDSEDLEAKVVIVKPSEKVSTRPWSQVNKIALRNKVMKLLEEGEAGAKKALYEIYGLVRCEDKMTCWKFPHHELIRNEVILNINGLRAAAVALLGARAKPRVTPQEKKEIATHLVRHYRQIEKEPPQRLKKLAAGEDLGYQLNLAIADEVFNEIESSGGDPDQLVGLLGLAIEVIDALVEEGIIEVDNSLDIEIKSRKDLEAFLMNIDKFVNNLVGILVGEGEAAEDLDKVEDDVLKKLEEELAELSKKNEELKGLLAESQAKAEKVAEVEKERDILKATIEELKNEKKLLEEKLLVLAEDYIEATGNQSFIQAVMDAESEKELKLISQLRKDISSTRGIKKNSVFKHLGIFSQDETKETDPRGKEEELEDDIEKRVKLISSLI